MPVVADSDEPPAKCCKFCEESTHSVDGPVSWRLTLDQDLIDTLKGSFPGWFSNSPVTTSSLTPTSPSSSSSSSSSASSCTSIKIQTSLDSCNNKILSKITAVNKSYQEGVLHETADGMAEGDQISDPLCMGPSSLLGRGGVVENISATMTNCYDIRQSPPKAIVDSSPLQPQMDKNKESLKVKLMVRRPITQLVEQGIIPPLKTSPAIHEQCKQLERAKTGDLLKAKIQQRPNRQELERRHILEHDESHVDPSLAEKQRMLKKARLADQLNSQISHRPGPLELIKKNILHTEKPIERIVKEGLVTFKATSEGHHTRPQQPSSYITFEDDSQSSESDTRNTPPRQDVLEAAAASAGIVTVALTIPTSGGAVVVTSAPVLQTKFHPAIISTPYVPPPPPPPPPGSNFKFGDHIQVKQDTSNLFAELCQSVAGASSSPSFLPLAASPASLGSTTSTLSPLSSVSSPPQSITPRPSQSPLQQQQHQMKSDAPGKDKNRKKSKSKPISKTRTIKFHEYKGPPNAQKINNSETNNTEETSYQLMLEQQNCLLKFLEKLNKNQAILPTNSKNSNGSNEIISQIATIQPPPLHSPVISVSSSVPPSPVPSYGETTTSAVDIAKLEKMKVSDLKMHLKKRNLPVSGPKPQLIERLKPYLPLDSTDLSSSIHESMCAEMCDVDILNSPHNSLSPDSEQENIMDIQQIDSPSSGIISVSNEDIVREQQRRIDELQRQLERSQQELQQIRQRQQNQQQQQQQQPQQQQIAVTTEPPQPPPPINQKLVVKQQLEAKIQKQQAKQQAQLMMRNKNSSAIAPKQQQQEKSIMVPSSNQISMTAKPNNLGLVWNGENQTLLLVGLQDRKLMNGHQRAASMPSIVFPFPTVTATSQSVEQKIEAKPLIHHPITTMKNKQEIGPLVHVDLKPPPLYEEAARDLSVVSIKEEPQKKSIKSENLTDVLDILIKNGDLPESALISTPTPTAESNVISQDMLFTPKTNNGELIIKSEPAPPTQSLDTSDSDIFSTSLILETSPSIQNIDMASPTQPDSHIDTESIAKTLDVFLEQQQCEERPQNTNEINHFDDLELLELMSQQLDMDIGDDTSSHNNFTSIDSNLQKPLTNLHVRRDMNPSLQPSINELIQQQQQQQHHQHQQQQQQNTSSRTSNTNMRTNGAEFGPSSFDLNNSNNNFSSTPMDVCDDFDNPLANFSFSTLSQDSNINTPPHPFSSGLSSSSSIMSDNVGPSMSVQQFVGGNQSPSSCSNSGVQLTNRNDNDNFGSHAPINQDNILDLFNIDDYKMMWGEVDFAV